MPDGMVLVGLPGSLPELRFIHREIFIDNTYTSHGVTIRDGDCIVDVGANVGLFSLFALDQACNLRIVAFEPLRPIFEALQANVNAIEVDCRRRGHTLTLINAGLSSIEQTPEMTFYPNMPGNSTLHPAEKAKEAAAIAKAFRMEEVWRLDKLAFAAMLLLFPLRRQLLKIVLKHRFQSGQRCRTHLRRLSDVLAEERVDRVDLLKIDVEGAELDVLGGLIESDWARVKQLVMEIAPANLSHVAPLAESLRTRGFEHVVVAAMDGHARDFGERGQGARTTISLPKMLYAIR
ncbi:FkbM family methyltransferase [Stieleria magnilauensis]|uniref:31-O-demethyl-FK506 methyltransferase FkbM n=1 Tax=Stieleria magnilauensis TaxID=2527963 RepID=A0ABX5Y028_9BACT|nr:31-O-demethyl-FK506 methyltransferase FkbM [Planctomycetes bacterium TBK1r]